MKLTQLATPALVADEKILIENMRAMEDLLHGRKLQLRPHYKSNKCSAIAHMQMGFGAIGITCAKLSEAEDLADSGIEDILIANQIVDPEKMIRAALLAKKCRLTVCVDSEDNARLLSRAAEAAGSLVHCYVEYDIGMRRCGVTSEEDFVRLAKIIDGLPGLEFSGIQAYAGNIAHVVSGEERKRETRANEQKIVSLTAKLKGAGLEVKAVSGGSTGTSVLKAQGGVYTELQAGSYIFLDSTYGGLESLPFKNSLFVLATVISTREGLAILDVGVKGLGVDQDPPVILTMDGERIDGEVQVNEEHLKLFGPSGELVPGEMVKVIPGHCCSTVNLYDRLYLFDKDLVKDRLMITARGCSR
ncbi:MAG: alanine racemase [Firmicutes bacterium]|nr:alanine racemase [Bacillota bacterium]MBQ6261360.1 alanine racemase [Bacillota bacterium]